MPSAINNKHIHVLGSEKRFRDFVYIDDVVKACIMAANGIEIQKFNVYTIATNKKTEIGTLVNLIVSKLPFDVSVEYKGSTPGDQFGIYCSYDLIKSNLGWIPETNLQEWISKMIDWAIKNTNRSVYI